MKGMLSLILLAGTIDTSGRRGFQDDFSFLRSHWERVAGTWTIENGAVVGRGEGAPEGNAILRLRTRFRTVRELEVEVSVEKCDTWAGMHLQFGGRYFYLYAGGGGIYPPYEYANAVLKRTTMKIRLTRERDVYRMTVDGELVCTASGRPAPELREDVISLWATHGAAIRYDNLKVK